MCTGAGANLHDTQSESCYSESATALAVVSLLYLVSAMASCHVNL